MRGVRPYPQPLSLHLYKKREYPLSKLSNRRIRTSETHNTKNARSTKTMKQFFVRIVRLFLFLALLIGCHSGKNISIFKARCDQTKTRITFFQTQFLRRVPRDRRLSDYCRAWDCILGLILGKSTPGTSTKRPKGFQSFWERDGVEPVLCFPTTIWTETTVIRWIPGCGSALDLEDCKREILKRKTSRSRTLFSPEVRLFDY